MKAEDVQLTPRLIKHNLEYYTYGKKVNPVYYEDPSNVKITDKILNSLDTIFGLDQRNKKLFEQSILAKKISFLEIAQTFIKSENKSAIMVKLFVDDYIRKPGRPIFGVGLAKSNDIDYIVFIGHREYSFIELYFPIQNKIFDFNDIDLNYIHSTLEKKYDFILVQDYLENLTKPRPIADASSKKARDLFGGLMD